MTGRHLALVLASAAVLALAVYLFVQVRAIPARAHAPAPAAASAAPAAPTPDPAPAPSPPSPAPSHPVPAAPPPTAPSLGTSGGSALPRPVLDRNHAWEAGGKLNPKLNAIMDQANKAYDHQDYETAMDIARKVLRRFPKNVRMLRIMVSASCIAGDPMVAQKYYTELPQFDRHQMAIRCNRFGVTFTEPAH